MEPGSIGTTPSDGWPTDPAAMGADLAHRLGVPDHQRVIIDALSEGVLVQDISGTVLYASDATRILFEHVDPVTVTPKPGWTLIDEHGTPLPTEQRPGRIAVARREAVRNAVVGLAGPAGEVRWLEINSQLAMAQDGDTPVAIVSSIRDITEQRSFEARIAHQATHDQLTGLPNRRALLAKLDAGLHLLSRAAPDHTASLLLVSIASIDVVNDAYGHATGDALVLACADALAHAVHADDLLARFSDHAFAVFCPHATDADQHRGNGEDLRLAVHRPFTLGGLDIQVRAAAGMAIATAETDASELLRHADLALLRARRHGTTLVYDRDMDAQLRREVEVAALVDRVIATGQVTLGYQPMVRLDDGHPVGAEALLRLTDDQGAPVNALDAISAAERNGAIADLGALILHTACAEAARWARTMPDRRLHISVNVSGLQLDDHDLLHHVDAALASSGLDPSLLWLEITESALMEDPERSIVLLGELHARGITLAADDFGTGYSSLSHLKRLPLDVVKIDQSFVSGLPDDREDLAITRAIMAMAAALDLDVVAEGVETEGQLVTLRALGLACGQGWLWSPALTPPDFEAYVRSQPTASPEFATATD